MSAGAPPHTLTKLWTNLSISLGANICSKDGFFDLSAIRSITRQLGELASRGYHIAAVVGTGGAGKIPLEVASHYENDRRELDQVAMRVSRINAMVLIASLRSRSIPSFPLPLTRVEQLDGDWFLNPESGVIAVFGGLRPGLTSDSVAALVARRLDCALVIVSTQGAIYSEDPRLTKAARPLKFVDRKYLRDLAAHPLPRHVLDVQTCRILLGMEKGSEIVVTGYRNIADLVIGGKVPALHTRIKV